MNSEVLVTTCLIILARIADVWLGTGRTVAVVNGRKGMALGLGFFEVLSWGVAVSKVVTNLESPIYALAYAGWSAVPREVVEAETIARAMDLLF